MPNTPVITILYIISDNCGPAYHALRIRMKVRLLSLAWNLEGHNPYPCQVLQIKIKNLPCQKKFTPGFDLEAIFILDRPVGLRTAQKLVMSPYRVARHAFYPLIRYEINSLKVFENDEGELEKKRKPREIKYAAHLDSHIYSYYAWILGKYYESELLQRGLNDNILAFRKLEKSNIDFANEAFNEISERGRCAAIGLDVSRIFRYPRS